MNCRDARDGPLFVHCLIKGLQLLSMLFARAACELEKVLAAPLLAGRNDSCAHTFAWM